MIIITCLILVVGINFGLSNLNTEGFRHLQADPRYFLNQIQGATFFISFIFMMLVSACLFCTFLLAVGLIILANQSVPSAISLALNCTFKNLVPLTLWFVTLFAVGVLSCIPLGLGLIVFAPVSYISMYVATTELFVPVQQLR